MNDVLRKKAKKYFLKLMNNTVFGKTIENVRKHRDIKHVTTERIRNYLLSEPNYHVKTFFTEKFLSNRNEKAEILMNKPVGLGLSILELSKILIYEIWYDYLKLNYGGHFIKLVLYRCRQFHYLYIKTDDIYNNIA